MDAQFEYGPRYGSDSAEETPWLGAGGSVTGSEVWGRYSEVTRRGLVFIASSPGAGAGIGAGFTTTPPFALWNPPSSGKNLCILKSSIAAVGALATVADWVAYGQVAVQTSVPTGGTVLTPVNGLLGNQTVGTGRAFSGSTLAGTPVLVRPVYSGGTANTTPNLFSTSELVDGELIIAPGAVLVIQGQVATATGNVVISVSWAELPLSAQ